MYFNSVRGNFLRGFVDWMIDKLNKENGGDYGVTIVQPLAGGLVDKLNAQDGRYSLYLRGLLKGEKVEETRIVDCVTRGINPYTNTDEFLTVQKSRLAFYRFKHYRGRYRVQT